MIRKWVVIGLWVLGMASGLCAQDVSPSFSIHFPKGWKRVSLPTANPLYWCHPNRIATVSVSSLSVPKTASAGMVMGQRDRGKYEGWIQVFQREGTPSENRQAHAKSSFLSVYGRQTLREDLSIAHWLIAEYCFIYDQTAFILSIQSNQDSWLIIQKDLKSILRSFSIESI